MEDRFTCRLKCTGENDRLGSAQNEKGSMKTQDHRRFENGVSCSCTMTVQGLMGRQ